MPVYQYTCSACGYGLEREHRITRAPMRKCPACAKYKLVRTISNTAFILKGGDWAKDHYGLGSKKGKK